jgi:hypothetical protein
MAGNPFEFQTGGLRMQDQSVTTTHTGEKKVIMG